MTSYKAEGKTGIYYTIGSLLFLGITAICSAKFSFYGGLILTIVFLMLSLFYILTLRLNEIHLDEINGCIIFIFRNYIHHKKSVKYKLSQIEFTYKRQASSFRGGIKNICTIYHAGKKVIQIIPGNDDWNDEAIRRLVCDLIAVDVKKKFTGFSLKDVEI